MGNDLTTFFGTEMGNLPTKSVAAGLRAASLDRDSSNRFVESLEGRELLKFASRTQKWVFGKEEEPLGDDCIAVNPGSFVHGRTVWTGGNNSTFVDEIMVPITNPLPEPKAGWEEQGDVSKQVQVDLQPIEGEFKGEPLRFRANSYGGVNAVQDLAGKLADRLEEDAHDGFFIPVVLLEYSTYDHKTWGRLGNPIFKIVDWMNTDGKRESGGGKKKAIAPPADTSKAKAKGRGAGHAAAEKEPAPQAGRRRR
jgi:hypothetical protein